MQLEDIPLVAAIAADEATAPHWPQTEYKRMLDVIAESPERRGAWVLLAPVPPGIDPPRIEGFCMAIHVAGICDLEAVVVRAASRGKRFGTALVHSVIAWGRALHASRLELEVRVSNLPALKLDQRLGFTLDGTRPGYYRNPEEDAALMSLRLFRDQQDESA
jgi:ribosomal-protein-alanine N-acetyltransferase